MHMTASLLLASFSVELCLYSDELMLWELQKVTLRPQDTGVIQVLSVTETLFLDYTEQVSRYCTENPGWLVRVSLSFFYLFTYLFNILIIEYLQSPRSGIYSVINRKN